MASLKMFILLSVTVAVLRPLAVALPTAATKPYFFFSPSKTTQDWCSMWVSGVVPAKPSSMRYCQGLRSNLKESTGTYVIGGFDANKDLDSDDRWMTISTNGTCTLSVQPRSGEDLDTRAQWLVGDADAYYIVTEAVEIYFEYSHTKHRDLHGEMKCEYSGGGVKYLRYRVVDTSED